MKYLILLFLLCASPAFAGGDIYFGKYFGQTIFTSGDVPSVQQPNKIQPNYVAGVQVEKTFGWVTPSVLIETLMSEQNSNGSFNPMSVKYDVGLLLAVTDNVYVQGNRMCNHPIGTAGVTEEYYSVKAGYKW